MGKKKVKLNKHVDSCENSTNGELILKIILVARHISKLWKILEIQIMVLVEKLVADELSIRWIDRN